MKKIKTWDLRQVDTSVHPEEIMIRSMQRTLVVAAWASFVEENHKALGRCHPMGCELMEWLPDVCDHFDRESYRAAAILYGRIRQAWPYHPWVVLLHRLGRESLDPKYYRLLIDWSHYAVMEALGHGVSWADSNDPVTWQEKPLPSVGEMRIHTESFQWGDSPGQRHKRPELSY